LTKFRVGLLGTPYEPSIAPSFPNAREQYLEAAKWRPRVRYQITRWLRLYFHWTKRIDQITPHVIMLAIEAIKSLSEANHAFQSIRALFAWCVPRYLKTSPCMGLKQGCSTLCTESGMQQWLTI